jgi:hypothetical protein
MSFLLSDLDSFVDVISDGVGREVSLVDNGWIKPEWHG